MICLTSARFNMQADILRQGVEDDGAVVPTEDGEWVLQQNPESGAIKRVWQPYDLTDDPGTTEVETLQSFPCEARGIIDGGIRVNGTTERWDEVYSAVDYVKITFPANVKLTRRDRVTNIRDKNGNVIWKEEENGDKPTVFNVSGVTPVIDPFGRHVESFAMLQRVGAQ